VTRILFWVLTGVAALFVASFVVSNRQPVELGLFPLPDLVALPLWLVVFGAMAVGIASGLLISWIRHGGLRADRRRHARRARALEAELAELRPEAPAAKTEGRALVGRTA
jgi:uncharacterized integral membrane protein